MKDINNYKILIKNLGVSIVITLMLLLALSLILSLTDISEKIMGISIIFISSFSVLTGAFLASKKIKEKGIVFGSILGLVYILVLYIISSIANGNFNLSLSVIYMLAGEILGGAIGGILGVNFK